MLPSEQRSGSCGGKRQSSLLCSLIHPGKAPQSLLVMHQVPSAFLTARLTHPEWWGLPSAGGAEELRGGPKKDGSFVPGNRQCFVFWKPCFQLVPSTGTFERGLIFYRHCSGKRVAWGCGLLRAAGACLPLVLREDVRSFLQPLLQSDSTWGEARNTPAIQEKWESSEGDAKRKRSFVLDLGEGDITRLRHKGCEKNIYLSQKVVIALQRT